MKYQISIEIVDTGESFVAIRDGIENTLEAARNFMWRNLEKRPTKHAPDVVESAASVSISPASAESASEGNTPPAPAQVA